MQNQCMTKSSPANANPAHHIAVFQETTIRRTWHNEEWWFSVVDVCAIQTESPDAGAYWRKLKQWVNAEGSQPATFCHGLKLVAPDGKQRETDCANTEGLCRIIQSIPSPQAGPFKRWLAQVGYERVKEIENPDLAPRPAKLDLNAMFNIAARALINWAKAVFIPKNHSTTLRSQSGRVLAFCAGKSTQIVVAPPAAQTAPSLSARSIVPQVSKVVRPGSDTYILVSTSPGYSSCL